MRAKDIPGYLMLWAIAGTFTVALFVAVEGKDTLAWPEYLGVMALWPLFVIKYLAIGLYMVFSAGFGALL